MGFFRRSAEHSTEFWRNPPFRADSAVLHERGITAYVRDDGKTMLACGWAIWRQSGMHSEQARDLIIDGYGLWRVEPTTSYEDRIAFLCDLFDTLQADSPPSCPPDIFAVPRELVEPALDYYGTIAWAGAELIEQALEAGDEPMNDAYAQPVYEALVNMNRGFLSGRDAQVARKLAFDLGLPDPFPVHT